MNDGMLSPTGLITNKNLRSIHLGNSNLQGKKKKINLTIM